MRLSLPVVAFMILDIQQCPAGAVRRKQFQLLEKIFIHGEKVRDFQCSKAFLRLRAARKYNICVRKRKYQRYCPLVWMKQESGSGAGFFLFAVGASDINTAMPVPITGIQKMADMFCVRNTVGYFHSHLQIPGSPL